MKSFMTLTNSIDERALLLNQTRGLLRILHSYGDVDHFPQGLVSQNLRLIERAESLFGREVRTYIVNPPQTWAEDMMMVISSVQSLLDYLEFKISDPVASQLIGNEIETARWAAKQNLPICAVLLCRVAQEQTMRRLCDRIGIDYAPDTQPSTLAQKLRQENGGPFKKHFWKAIEAKLTYEGEVLHARVSPDVNDVRDLIQWTEKFSQELDAMHSTSSNQVHA